MSLITEHDLQLEIMRLNRELKKTQMTLLDEFAKAALSGFVAHFGTTYRADLVVRDSFILATEALKQREALCVPTP
jgi:hypothetical protein